MLDARNLIGTHDALFITLDTLRYDVARDALAEGRTPNLAAVLPGGVLEERHSPGNFTYAAHHAFFAGFLPTPISPGPHPRLFAARFEPEELYLYPLYVRPLTGLGRRGQKAEDDLRPACYRAGRELLLELGYRQVSMRMFQRAQAPATDGPAYCCQNDGMVGLGCGARSYTRALHYSGEYAVGATGVREILAAYFAKAANLVNTDDAFDFVDYGFRLDGVATETPQTQRR